MKISRITVVNYAMSGTSTFSLVGMPFSWSEWEREELNSPPSGRDAYAWSRGRLQSELGVEVLRDPTLPLVCRVVLNDFSDDDQAAFPMKSLSGIRRQSRR